MGREIRRVPPNWIHPVGDRGLKPLHDNSFDAEIDERIESRRKWNAGEDAARARYEADVGHPVAFHEWNGGPPDPEYCRPAWPEESRTAYQVYETVSEGTPVSPVFPTKDELIDWLVNVGSGMGVGGRVQRMSREAAERFAEAAWAPSMVFCAARGVESGLAIHESPAPSIIEKQTPTSKDKTNE